MDLLRWSRNRLLHGALLSIFWLSGCKTAQSASDPAAGGDSDEFVRVDPEDRSKLSLRGKEYRFSAANSYSMLKSKEAADKQFAMMRDMGTNALRMWGFWNGSGDSLQPQRGQYAEHKWKLLDYVIDKAAKENIKLILPLANYWDEFGGIVVLNSWVGHPPEGREYFDREIFFRDDKSRQLYKEYVLYMLNRRNTINGRLYKEDPTIMMWEPMNEARGRSDASGRMIVDWLAWSSQLIKENAPLQLVGTGTEGFFRSHPKFSYYPWQASNPPSAVRPNGKVENLVAEGSYFELDCQIPTIDLCSIHAWPYQWFVEPVDQPEIFMQHWIDEHIAFMKSDAAYNKPLYLAEFGWQLFRKEGDQALQQRERVFKASFFTTENGQERLREGMAGIGFWNISDNEYPDPNSLTFDVVCPRDQNLCQIIRDFSKQQVKTP